MPKPRLRTIYTVTVRGSSLTPHETENLTEAIREWDKRSSAMGGTTGGIGVQTFDENDVMVRDGYILAVYPGGHVYLNPNLLDAAVTVLP